MSTKKILLIIGSVLIAGAAILATVKIISNSSKQSPEEPQTIALEKRVAEMSQEICPIIDPDGFGVITHLTLEDSCLTYNVFVKDESIDFVALQKLLDEADDMPAVTLRMIMDQGGEASEAMWDFLETNRLGIKTKLTNQKEETCFVIASFDSLSEEYYRFK